MTIEEFTKIIEANENIDIKELMKETRENRVYWQIEATESEDDFEKYTIDITLEVLLMEQNNDLTLQDVRKWLVNKTKPGIIETRAQPILVKYAKFYEHLYLCPKTGLIYIFEHTNEYDSVEEDEYFTKPKIVIPRSLIIPIF